MHPKARIGRGTVPTPSVVSGCSTFVADPPIGAPLAVEPAQRFVQALQRGLPIAVVEGAREPAVAARPKLLRDAVEPH